MKKNVYPYPPRLSPTGMQYVCDQCQRRWLPGADPGCPECNAAFVELEEAQATLPNVSMETSPTGGLVLVAPVFPKSVEQYWCPVAKS